MPKPCQHDSHAMYAKLIGPIRACAAELGYAIGVHGTLVRDIDLIACPWISDACDAKVLWAELEEVIKEHNGGIAFRLHHEDDKYFRNGSPGAKPHGRLCWTWHLGGGPYIDLSVMPKHSLEYVICDDPAKAKFRRLET